MSAKHTPGPWMIEDGTANSTYISSQKQKQFCSVWGGGCTDPFLLPDEWRANANLIAAAPELLEALKLIKSQSIGSDWTAEQALAFIKETANAAIARAEGGTR